MSDRIHDVIVIGGGPAGATAAALLARRGLDVLVLERSAFPRDKVCGEFLSWDAMPVLSVLSLTERLDAAGAPFIARCALVAGERRMEFLLPGLARGITRSALDEMILRRAAELGAIVQESATVSDVVRESESFTVTARADDVEMRWRGRLVIGAWGRWGRLDHALGRSFVERGSARHFGFKSHFTGGEWPADLIEIHPFDGGYLGLSPVETGAVNLCGLVREERIRGMKGGWPRFVGDLRSENRSIDRFVGSREPAQDAYLSSEPVIFTARSAASNGMIFLGDSAGLVDPLAGSGMAMAIQSAAVAVPAIVESLLSGRPTSASKRYVRDFRAGFSARIRWSRFAAAIVSRPRVARLAAMTPSFLGRFVARRSRAEARWLERLEGALRTL